MTAKTASEYPPVESAVPCSASMARIAANAITGTGSGEWGVGIDRIPLLRWPRRGTAEQAEYAGYAEVSFQRRSLQSPRSRRLLRGLRRRSAPRHAIEQSLSAGETGGDRGRRAH